MLLIDGVNKCLRAIGEIRVPDGVDIDSLDPLHEAVQIRDIIEEKNKELQLQGWWFNRENWEFLVNTGTNKIDIPVTVIAIKGTSKEVVVRGNNLYDVENKTLLFTDSVECDTVFLQEFEETPESFATWVVLQAAQEAQWTFKGDDLADSRLDREVQKAFVKVEREHLKNKSYNLITSSRLIDRGSNPTPVS